MRKLFGFIVDNRDWFSLTFSIALSLFLLSNNESPDVQILRGKFNSVLSVIYAPVNWVQGIGTLREENDALRAKAVQLSLLNSELLHYKTENERLKAMLDYKESVWHISSTSPGGQHWSFAPHESGEYQCRFSTKCEAKPCRGKC